MRAARMLVSIDANIGAGKTTCLGLLRDRHGMAVDMEPVERWAPALKAMYESGRGHFEFQRQAFADRCGPRAPTKGGVLVVERSPLFTARVFLNAYARNFTPPQLTELRRLYAQESAWAPDLYVYLRTQPSGCAARVAKRARPGERVISLAYLQELHRLHEEALPSPPHAVVVVEAEGRPPGEVADEVASHIHRAQM